MKCLSDEAAGPARGLTLVMMDGLPLSKLALIKAMVQKYKTHKMMAFFTYMYSDSRERDGLNIE